MTTSLRKQIKETADQYMYDYLLFEYVELEDEDITVIARQSGTTKDEVRRVLKIKEIV